MNKEWVLFHLREAQEEIESTISDLENDKEYGEEEYSVAIAHIYHHLNTAWNSRNFSDSETENSDSNFEQWRQFPKDLDISC